MHSVDLFQVHQLLWKYYGMIFPKRLRIPYLIYSIIYNIGVTLILPLHLIIGIFNVKTKSDMFENLAITFANIVCSFKTLVIWYHLKEIKRINVLLEKLDSRIRTLEEKHYIRNVFKRCKRLLYVTAGFYAGAVINAELSNLLKNGRSLMYPAWFPMEVEVSALNYWIAHMYQLIAISLQCSSDFASDTYYTICLALLSGHVRLLRLRVSNLGKNKDYSGVDNKAELKLCINDHQNLIKLYKSVQKILSVGMFMQICVTSITLTLAVICLIFFSNNLINRISNSLFLFAMALEIYPCCYYGSAFEKEFQDLTYAIFSCNWMDQDKEFKTNVIIFSERSLYPTQIFCMGIFRIHLDTFFAVVKSAYSLFAVVVQTN